MNEQTAKLSEHEKERHGEWLDAYLYSLDLELIRVLHSTSQTKNNFNDMPSIEGFLQHVEERVPGKDEIQPEYLKVSGCLTFDLELKMNAVHVNKLDKKVCDLMKKRKATELFRNEINTGSITLTQFITFRSTVKVRRHGILQGLFDFFDKVFRSRSDSVDVVQNKTAPKKKIPWSFFNTKGGVVASAVGRDLGRKFAAA